MAQYNTEQVELIAKGFYKTIPDVITISSIPTASELEYVGAEDFDRTILEKILPRVVENSEGMDFKELLDIDYDWICRCLRMKSYGPFVTINRIYCSGCNEISRGEYHGDLRNVGLTPLPEDFTNILRIEPDEFINFKEPITLHLLSAGEELTLQQDKSFDRKDGSTNIVLARLCYMIDSIGKHGVEEGGLAPLEVRSKIQKGFDVADYELLKDKVREITDYGIHTTGSITCPNCGAHDAYFVAFQSDKFFRPSVGDVKQWKSAIRSGDWKELLGNPNGYISVDN